MATDDGELVGERSLHGIDWWNPFAQVGVFTRDPANRGRGYGRIGVRHVIDWGSVYLVFRVH
nr:GNAT family N-acetyltransferase [Mycobacterium sp. 852013-50091_SCH5140682]